MLLLFFIILAVLFVVFIITAATYILYLRSKVKERKTLPPLTRELVVKKLRFNDVVAIEGWVGSGQVVEVRMTEAGVNVSHRPEEKSTMALPSPVLVNDSAHSNIIVSASSENTEFPVVIETFIVPPGFYFSGITGYQEKKD